MARFERDRFGIASVRPADQLHRLPDVVTKDTGLTKDISVRIDTTATVTLRSITIPPAPAETCDA